MTTLAVHTRSEVESFDDVAPRLWGLDVRALHDAYWAARGVQCVRRGERTPLQASADLFLLLDPDQLVLFRLGDLTERLTWHNAQVTRVRLSPDDGEPYSEHVRMNDDGDVLRIERQYRAAAPGPSRVILTSRRRFAEAWMAAGSRRAGWTSIRGAVRWSSVDHLRCSGQVFAASEPLHQRRLLTALIERWRRPDLVLDGIEQVEPGVWAPKGQALPMEGVRVGPIWLGAGTEHHRLPCVVGPAWISDEESASPATVTVRPIAEITPGARAVSTRPRSSRLGYAIAKRVFDITFSAAVLLGALPLLVIIAALIWLEDGRPIFFGHRRQTRGGREFRCWKFRTMLRNAEQIAQQLEEYNVCDGPQVYIRDDPRVTRVGRWLRELHLDELPQFWNVLVGQMSIVGPRPSPDRENRLCPAWRETRLSVRPGITGLWQLMRTRRPGEDFQEWIKYDIDYVHRAGIRLDMSILLRTVAMLLGRSNRDDD